MSKESLVFVLGIIIFLIPHLGVPEVWKGYLFSGIGIILVIVGYLLRRKSYLRSLDQGNGERATDTFVENTKPIDFTPVED